MQAVVERLDECRRTEDLLARLGGDEFVLVMPELGNETRIAEEKAQAAASRISDVLSKPLLLGEHNLNISASIGIKIFSGTQEEDVNDLLKHADTALYHAKNQGKGISSSFQPDMQKLAEHRLKFVGQLRKALATEQLILHYQPQVDDDGNVFGLEALVRWNHPDRGLIGPNEFVSVAEEIGAIDELGRYVLHRACSEYHKFPGKGFNQDVLKISINISPKHFLQPDFVSQIERFVRGYDLDRGCLILEITEGLLIHDYNDIAGKMNALRSLGVGFSMDDFGTGYSSLTCLKRLPLDTLKIDRSFIRDINSDPNDAAIVEATLAMTKSLGIDVIAEGVETESQYTFLKELGYKRFQGYLFGRPVPAADLINTGMLDHASSDSIKNNKLRIAD